MSWVLKWLLSQCPFVATPLFLCFPKLFMYQHMVLFACYPVLMWNIDIFLHKCLFIVQFLDLGSVIPLHSLSLCSLYFHEKSFLWQYFYTFRFNYDENDEQQNNGLKSRNLCFEELFSFFWSCLVLDVKLFSKYLVLYLWN